MEAVASLAKHLQEQIDLGRRKNHNVGGESADVHARREPAAAVPIAAPGPSSSKGAASEMACRCNVNGVNQMAAQLSLIVPMRPRWSIEVQCEGEHFQSFEFVGRNVARRSSQRQGLR